MLILSPADYRVMPWKNGGGTTTEIYAEPFPPAADRLAFLWRVSIADVTGDGPFSRFAGYERHIMCIDGSGMFLHGVPSGPGDVTELYRPFGFSGEWDVSASLVSGPVRDFNLISRRDRFTSSLASPTVSAALEMGSGATEFLYVLDGKLTADGSELSAGHSVLLRPGERIRLARASARPPRLAYSRMTEIIR